MNKSQTATQPHAVPMVPIGITKITAHVHISRITVECLGAGLYTFRDGLTADIRSLMLTKGAPKADVFLHIVSYNAEPLYSLMGKGYSMKSKSTKRTYGYVVANDYSPFEREITNTDEWRDLTYAIKDLVQARLSGIHGYNQTEAA